MERRLWERIFPWFGRVKQVLEREVKGGAEAEGQWRQVSNFLSVTRSVVGRGLPCLLPGLSLVNESVVAFVGSR